MGIDVNQVALSIFETENDSHLMDYKTESGIPVWMISRFYLMDYIVSSKLFSCNTSIRNRRISIKIIGFLIKAFFKNIKNRKLKKQREIVLYSTNRKTLLDNKFFNRYVDYFAKPFDENSYVIEQALLDWEWPFPRVNSNVVLDVSARIGSELYSKFHRRRYYKIVTSLVEYYLARVYDILQISFTELEKADMIRYISNQICVSENMARWVEKQITSKTKVFIMVGAGFPFNYPINTVLKKHNVVSVELQHGYITETSIMYNYAEAIRKRADVAAGLPDYILTYGEWWNEQMNCPIEKIAIGNPHHDYCVSKSGASSCEKRTIVVLGVDHNTEKYIELTEYLMAHFVDFNVVFRPHPGEVSTTSNIISTRNSKIQIDMNCEIYDTLNQAYAVISEISTVLFEAVGIVEKIIVIDTDYSRAFMPKHPFDRFERLEELDEIILNHQGLQYKGCDFWSDNCLHNYKNFVNKVLNYNR